PIALQALGLVGGGEHDPGAVVLVAEEPLDRLEHLGDAPGALGEAANALGLVLGAAPVLPHALQARGLLPGPGVDPAAELGDARRAALADEGDEPGADVATGHRRGPAIRQEGEAEADERRV